MEWKVLHQHNIVGKIYIVADNPELHKIYYPFMVDFYPTNEIFFLSRLEDCVKLTGDIVDYLIIRNNNH